MPIGPLRAFGYPFRGLRILFRAGFRRYSAIPLLINISLFSALGSFLFSNIGPWIDALLPPGGWHDYVRWLAWPLALTALLLLGYFAFTLVGSVVAAPFNDLLAARILSTSGTAGPGVPVRGLTWRGTWTSISDELRKLWYVASRLTDLMITVAICFFVAFAMEPTVNRLAVRGW